MSKFQSLTGRLQTVDCETERDMFLGFNPSQVGYKRPSFRST